MCVSWIQFSSINLNRIYEPTTISNTSVTSACVSHGYNSHQSKISVHQISFHQPRSVRVRWIFPSYFLSLQRILSRNLWSACSLPQTKYSADSEDIFFFFFHKKLSLDNIVLFLKKNSFVSIIPSSNPKSFSSTISIA